jgi:glycosyltransferase involved in cell wall biosynthesis
MALCSVIVAAYNVEEFVAETVESALAQTYPEAEVIVVNDGSTDGTASALEPFGDRIRYVEQPNRGLGAARNRGLQEAGGAYVALLDGDDVWLPDRLEKVIALLEQRPEFGFATSDAYFLDEASVAAETYYRQLPGGFRAADQNFWILEYNFIMGMAVIRRRLFEAHGTFDESLRTSEDWELWTRFLLRGERAGLVDEALAYYRRRSGSLSLDWAQSLRDALLVVERAVDRPESRAIPRLGTTLYKRGLQALAMGDLRRSKKFFSVAARDGTAPPGLRAKALVLASMPALGRRLYRRRRPEAFRAVAPQVPGQP